MFRAASFRGRQSGRDLHVAARKANSGGKRYGLGSFPHKRKVFELERGKVTLEDFKDDERCFRRHLPGHGRPEWHFRRAAGGMFVRAAFHPSFASTCKAVTVFGICSMLRHSEGTCKDMAVTRGNSGLRLG